MYRVHSSWVSSRAAAAHACMMGSVTGLAPLSSDHVMTVWSALAVASMRPSGLKASDETAPVWPVRPGSGMGWAGLEVFHSVTVRSLLAAASTPPVELKATA